MKLDFRNEQISLLLIRWKELNKELTELFEKRDRKKALPLMEEGVKTFIEFLFLSNEMEPNHGKEAILDIKWKPVNVAERLLFIEKRPDLYHSFIQLSELMNEQEKQFNKKIAIEKVTKP